LVGNVWGFIISGEVEGGIEPEDVVFMEDDGFGEFNTEDEVNIFEYVSGAEFV